MTPNQSGMMSQIWAVTPWIGAAKCGPELATGDFLTYSDTMEVAINSAHKKLHRKVHASCSITKCCLWLEAQLEQIGDSHAKLYGRVTIRSLRQSRSLLSRKISHSFQVNKMMDRTEQLLQIKEATHLKIHSCELEAGVQGRKKTLLQSLRQCHACYYRLVWEGHYLCHSWLVRIAFGQCFQVPLTFPPSVGLKSFCPWCLKLGRNTKTIAISTSGRYTIGWQSCATYAQWICHGMSAQSVFDHHSGCKAKNNKEHVQSVKGPQKTLRKRSLRDKRRVSQLHGQDACQAVTRSQNDALHLPCLVRPVNMY